MIYQVDDLEVNSKHVEITVKLIARDEPRYAKGFKITTFMGADETGMVAIPFWNVQSDTVKVGDFIQIQNGYVTEYPRGSGQLQLNIGRYGSFRHIDSPENFKVCEELVNAAGTVEGVTPIENLASGSETKNLTLQVLIQEKVEEKTVHTKRDGKEHRVATYLIGDESGCIYLALWDEVIDLIQVGMTVLITCAYVRTFRNQWIVNIGRYGTIEPSTTPITINSGNNLSAKGIVDGSG